MMNQLQIHDDKIKSTINSIQIAINNHNWMKIYDLNKHLSKLLKERKEYIKFKKIN